MCSGIPIVTKPIWPTGVPCVPVTFGSLTFTRETKAALSAADHVLLEIALPCKAARCAAKPEPSAFWGWYVRMNVAKRYLRFFQAQAPGRNSEEDTSVKPRSHVSIQGIE